VIWRADAVGSRPGLPVVLDKHRVFSAPSMFQSSEDPQGQFEFAFQSESHSVTFLYFDPAGIGSFVNDVVTSANGQVDSAPSLFVGTVPTVGYDLIFQGRRQLSLLLPRARTVLRRAGVHGQQDRQGGHYLRRLKHPARHAASAGTRRLLIVESFCVMGCIASKLVARCRTALARCGEAAHADAGRKQMTKVLDVAEGGCRGHRRRCGDELA
jgi:hypothetical protein